MKDDCIKAVSILIKEFPKLRGNNENGVTLIEIMIVIAIIISIATIVICIK
jgi:competence protein ComGC